MQLPTDTSINPTALVRIIKVKKAVAAAAAVTVIMWRLTTEVRAVQIIRRIMPIWLQSLCRPEVMLKKARLSAMSDQPVGQRVTICISELW